VTSGPMLTDYIESRTRDFTGREWVFRKIGDWLSDTAGRRIFLLTGGPGTGKTAVAARLAQMSLGKAEAVSYPGLGRDCLAYFHFCQAGLETTLSPLTFVKGLSEALANRYAPFRTALESGGSRQLIVNSNISIRGDVHEGAQVTATQVRVEIKGSDARPLFDEAVRRPLQMLCEQTPGAHIFILIDSLDEAIGFNAESNIVQLLRLADDFPPQVRCFLTCRSNSERVFDLVGEPTLDLIKDAPPGLDEVRLYALSRLSSVSEPMGTLAADRIAEKSKGNFLYAYHVLSDLVQRGADVSNADSLDLPDELEDVYRNFLRRELAASPIQWDDLYRPLLGSIAVAHGNGLTKAQLIGITNLAEDRAASVLTICGQYLVNGESDRRYRIYH
jgi:hypothetical protein